MASASFLLLRLLEHQSSVFKKPGEFKSDPKIVSPQMGDVPAKEPAGLVPPAESRVRPVLMTALSTES